MTPPSDLLKFAQQAVLSLVPDRDEAWDRRAVSASYYALFHRLCQASAHSFRGAGPSAQAQATRAYAHTEMRRVCENVLRPRRSAPLDVLLTEPIDDRLRDVASAFVALQQARHQADYNLAVTVTRQDALEAVRLSFQAFKAFAEIETDHNTSVFLAALLLGERWNK